MSTINAAQTYRRNSVMTASREKLVVMLYDGALRFLDEAVSSLERGETGRPHEALSRAFAIVGELRSSLDHTQSREIASDLERLYLFVQDRINHGNRDRNAKAIAEARSIMATLKEGWDGILRPI